MQPSTLAAARWAVPLVEPRPARPGLMMAPALPWAENISTCMVSFVPGQSGCPAVGKPPPFPLVAWITPGLRAMHTGVNIITARANPSEFAPTAYTSLARASGPLALGGLGLTLPLLSFFFLARRTPSSRLGLGQRSVFRARSGFPWVHPERGGVNISDAFGQN